MNRFSKLTSTTLTGVISLLALSQAYAEVKLAPLFTNHMVLQRDMPIPVWGKASPNEKVQVEFSGQTKSTTADSDGKWMLKLDPISASSEGSTMKVAGENSITIHDILVGEVWICSGQSNMAMAVGAVKEVKELIKTAKKIRSFTVERTVSFEENDTANGQWKTTHPSSAVAFAFAYSLKELADVPVGIILTAWGSSFIEGWMPRAMTQELPHFETIMAEFDQDTASTEKITAILKKGAQREKKEDIFLRTRPNIIYNAMMHPFIPFACRGIAWYQGEANSTNIEDMLQYGKSLPAWVTHYRGLWQQDELHFLAVMLPGFAKTLDPEDPNLISWAYFREQQMNILELPNTGIISSIDLGEVEDIHPKDKLPIGQRLALIAARDTLGQDITATGPMLSEVTTNGEQLVVHFKNAKGLKTTDGKAPTAFWISGKNQKWQRAEAAIQGSTVTLSCAEIDQPLYVRYAFSGKPEVNLVNSADLPAYPFRTDDFKP